MRRGLQAALVVALWLPAVAGAQPVAPRLSPPDAEEYEASNKAWVEQEANPPAYPKTSGLVEFRGGGVTSNRFFIDADTLSIGNDGVVRYILVIRSSAGAENVSFEGIRCATREQKYYAFGQRGGWSVAREQHWRLIEAKEINRHHGVLYTDIFCTDRATPPRAVREIVQRLRYGRL